MEDSEIIPGFELLKTAFLKLYTMGTSIVCTLTTRPMFSFGQKTAALMANLRLDNIMVDT